MSKRRIILISISVFIIIILAITYYFKKIGVVDDVGYYIIHYFHNDTITKIYKIITMFGGALAIAFLICLIFILDKKKGLYFFINVMIILIVNTIIKSIVMRARPDGINLIIERGYSFPSGHSMMSASVYGLIMEYLRYSKLNKKHKVILITFNMILMFLIPISRVYLGVHYFSDIVIGFCLSTIWILLYSLFLRKKGII